MTRWKRIKVHRYTCSIKRYHITSKEKHIVTTESPKGAMKKSRALRKAGYKSVEMTNQEAYSKEELLITRKGREPEYA